MGGLLKRAYPNATHQTLDVRGMWGNDPDQAGGRRYGALALVSHTHVLHVFTVTSNAPRSACCEATQRRMRRPSMSFGSSLTRKVW